MKKIFTVLTLLLCAVVGVKADDAISCSAFLTATENSPASNNCVFTYYSDEGQKGKVPGGTQKGSYYYSKMNNDKNYYEVKLSQSPYVTFQVGDVIKVYLYANGKNPTCILGKTSKTTITASAAQGSNGVAEYTLTASDIEEDGSVRIYRNSSKTYFEGVEITGTRVLNTESPSITTDLSETPYTATVSSPFVLSIVASNADGYQWYENTIASAEGGEAISGANNSSYTFTPSVEDNGTTKYFYCVAKNSNAAGNKSVVSKVATVNIVASKNVNVSSVIVVANGKYTASVNGTVYSATIGGKETASVTITPEDTGTAVVSCGGTTGELGQPITVDAMVGTPLTFSVMAGDGVTTKDYTLNLTKVDDKIAIDNAYYLTANEKIYGGQRIVGQAITMTFSTDEKGTFAAASADAYLKEINTNCVASTGGNGQNGALTDNNITGSWYKFSPKYNGTLSVGVIVNKDKTLSVSNGTNTTVITSVITYQSYGNVEFDENWKAKDKVYGIVTINVASGTDYYFTVTGGSKMGFYGFSFIPASESVAIGTAGWATTVTKNALDFSDIEGLDAYTAALSENTVTLTKVSNVAAGTGLVLKGNTGDYGIPVISSSETAKGSLNGSATEATAMLSGKIYYGLTVKGGKAEFAKINGTEIAAGKAFLVVDGSSARTFNVIFEGETTGIKNVVTVNAENRNDIFNLQGQRVRTLRNGLYIIGGKKVMVK